jgi:hypothetical protein
MTQIDRTGNTDRPFARAYRVRTTIDVLNSKESRWPTIDKRTNPNGTTKYRVRTRLKGFPSVSATFPRLTDARRWAAATESAQREGRHFASSEAKRHTFAEFIERYQRDVLPTKPKSARSQRAQLDWWKTQLGAYSLADITPAKIAECRDRLRNMPMPDGQLRSPATAVRYLAVLVHAFKCRHEGVGLGRR